jgi:3-methyladenine DNA glycosylase AlkC
MENAAPKLKNFFDAAVVTGIADSITAVHPGFAKPRFVQDCLRGLDRLELMARARHVAEQLRRHLPPDFERAAQILTRSLGPELDRTENFGMGVFRYLPYVMYVESVGVPHFEAAMQIQYELTKRFTAEFSIRAYLVKYPTETYERLLVWASDPNVHVRRLVSEGTRPRLPWAPRLRAFQADPTPVVALLELLKDDPEPYVRRSVANNLNDIGKDHPELLIEVCRRWARDAPAARLWIIRRALRSLVKRGDRAALGVLGFHARPKLELTHVELSRRKLKPGDVLTFSVEIASTSARAQRLLLDYVVYFVKANGSAAPKVFKLGTLVLPARERATLGGRVSFAALTTRKHYPGAHRLELLINGVPYPLGEAVLQAR